MLLVLWKNRQCQHKTCVLSEAERAFIWLIAACFSIYSIDCITMDIVYMTSPIFLLYDSLKPIVDGCCTERAELNQALYSLGWGKEAGLEPLCRAACMLSHLCSYMGKHVGLRKSKQQITRECTPYTQCADKEMSYSGSCGYQDWTVKNVESVKDKRIDFCGIFGGK